MANGNNLDGAIFGFNRTDANQLVNMLGNAGGEKPNGGDNWRGGLILALTGGSGIAASSSATVERWEPTTTSWAADDDIEYEAFNVHRTAAVGADKLVLLAACDGRWVVVWEEC